MENQDYIDFMNTEKTEKQGKITEIQQSLTQLDASIDQANTNIIYYKEQKNSKQIEVDDLNAEIQKIDDIITILSK